MPSLSQQQPQQQQQQQGFLTWDIVRTALHSDLVNGSRTLDFSSRNNFRLARLDGLGTLLTPPPVLLPPLPSGLLVIVCCDCCCYSCVDDDDAWACFVDFSVHAYTDTVENGYLLFAYAFLSRVTYRSFSFWFSFFLLVSMFGVFLHIYIDDVTDIAYGWIYFVYAYNLELIYSSGHHLHMYLFMHAFCGSSLYLRTLHAFTMLLHVWCIFVHRDRCTLIHQC